MAAYLLAALLTLVALMVRRALVGEFDGEAVLNIFLIPIILSAYWGGVGPGVAATLLSALAADYYLLSPTHSFLISDTPDRLEWLLLVVVGVLISKLTETLRRSRLQDSANERQHQVTLESIGDAVITTDNQGYVTFLNGVAEQITGWSFSAAKNRSLSEVFRIVNEQTRQPVEDPVSKVLNCGAVVDLANHTVLISRDGREVPIDDSGAPIKQEDGTIVGVVLVFRDCTEKKKAEVALRDSMALYHSLVEQIPAGLFRKDANGRYVFVNSLFCELGHLKPEQYLGRTAEEFASELATSTSKGLDPERVRELSQVGSEHHALVMQTGQRIELEEERTFRDGRKQYLQVIKSPVFDSHGKTIGSQGILYDITQRKEAEAALQDSMALYHSLVEQIPAGLFRKNAEGQYVFVNSWFCRLKGIKAEHFLGKKPQETAAIELTVADANPSQINRLAAQGKDHHQQIMETGRQIEIEEHGVGPDGKEQYLHVVKSPIFDSNGKIIGSQGVLIDITQRKEAEAALQDSMALYHSLVEQIPAGLFRKDAEGRYVFVNSVFCQLKAMRPEQFFGKTALEVGLTDTVLANQGADHHAHIMKTGEIIEVEEEYVHDGGEILHFHVVKAPVFDGNRKIIGSQGILYDITQRKEAEAALCQKQVQLEEALQIARQFEFSTDQATDAVFWVTQDAGFSYVNEQACRTLNYTREELMQLRLWDVDPTFPKDCWDAQWKKHQNNHQGSTHHFETSHRRKDGSTFPVNVSTQHIWVGDTELHIAVARDITENKRMQEALTRERSLLRTLIDNLPDGIYAKDTGGRKILANPADCKSYHCKTEAEAIGKNDFDLFPKDIAEKFWADDQMVIQGQPVINREEYFPDDEGRRRWLLTSKLPLRDQNGKIIGLVGIGRDITERKRAEEELFRLNKSLQTLSKCNEALVRTADETTLLKKICQIITETGGCRLAWVGYAEQDEAKSVRPVAWTGVEDSYLKDLRITWADTERGHGPVGTAIRTSQPAIFTNLAEHPNFKPWREEASRCGLASCVGLPLKAGDKTFGVLCVYSSRPDAFNATETRLLTELANDLAFGITTLRNRNERKQLEEQLRQSQKMEAVGLLAGGVAHDFNNMLTVIQGNASMLLNPQLNAGEQKESAQQIVRAAERAASLTRQLLLFSRKQVMQAVPLNLNETVGNMTKMLQRILGEDISLNATYAGNLPNILADPGMIEQILMNLSVNSRDAMPKGGRLTITTSTETLDEKLAGKRAGIAPGLYACLNVTDSGCGIASETLPHIFEPFYTTKEAGKGTGLGLATIYGIVQQHHGWIDVNSQAGQGTSFRIYLPAAKDQLPKSPAASALAKLPGGNETILLVEDEPPVRLLASNLLQRCGYTVLVAESGAAAFPIWKEHRERINLLLTDMVMPEGVSGRELAEKLTADRPELKVIYTSGYSTELIGKEPRLIEGRNFLQKPYQPFKLAQLIRDCLNQNGKTS